MTARRYGDMAEAITRARVESRPRPIPVEAALDLDVDLANRIADLLTVVGALSLAGIAGHVHRRESVIRRTLHVDPRFASSGAYRYRRWHLHDGRGRIRAGLDRPATPSLDSSDASTSAGLENGSREEAA